RRRVPGGSRRVGTSRCGVPLSLATTLGRLRVVRRGSARARAGVRARPARARGPPVTTRIAPNCFRLDRRLAAGAVAECTRLIDARATRGYLQNIRIEDAAGQLLETRGPTDCFAALALWDRHGFPADFTGKAVLDVGCDGGFFSFVAKLRGATRVVGV